MKPSEPAPSVPRGARLVAARALRDARVAETSECLAEERPVALEYNGISHAVMMATPADLEDFALGFSLTEGIIERREELLEVESTATVDAWILRLRVTARAEARLKERRRSLAGRTGCGLCGVDSLEQVRRRPAQALAQPVIRASALTRAPRELVARQPLQHATGATHAAACCDLEGAVRLVREDVGRHNALDKLVGAMARAGVNPAGCLIAITSRASIEMVQKTAMAGVSILAAVSAPTDLAVEAAREAGVLLAGFVREYRATIYCGEERVRP